MPEEEIKEKKQSRQRKAGGFLTLYIAKVREICYTDKEFRAQERMHHE